jgi:NADH-quinone oxidoreductase subunit J
MVIQAGFFYLFSFLAVIAGAMVISARNPVHSVLFLIFAFFNAAGIFILLGAEFLAMSLVIVYVGAVAVLFLFVVMMLDINYVKIKQGFIKYLPICLLIIGVLVVDLFLLLKSSVAKLDKETISQPTFPIPAADELTNTHAIGKILYIDYIYPFQISGIILLVAMISSIVLTLRHREGVRKQNAFKQFNRKKEDSIKVMKVETGVGVNEILK